MDKRETEDLKTRLAEFLLSTLTYDEMVGEQEALVTEYETEKWKPKVDSLRATMMEEKMEEQVHDCWLDYQFSDGTEKNLLAYIRGISDGTKRFLLTCPVCGNSTWLEKGDDGFACLVCGGVSEPGDMREVPLMEKSLLTQTGGGEHGGTRIFLTCPACGNSTWLERGGEGFECLACGEISEPEDMCGQPLEEHKGGVAQTGGRFPR